MSAGIAVPSSRRAGCRGAWTRPINASPQIVPQGRNGWSVARHNVAGLAAVRIPKPSEPCNEFGSTKLMMVGSRESEERHVEA